MTNVEAGRLLATPPQRLLAARPLFDSPGAGPLRLAGVPRGKSFSAPTVELVGSRPQAMPGHAVSGPPVLAAAPVVPPAPQPATAPEAWTARGLRNVFDPAAGEPTDADKAAPAPVLLEHAAPVPPKDAPPAPPK
jgi:hypothetical protein